MASKAAVRPFVAMSASMGLKRGFATAQRTNKTTPFQQPLRAGKKLDKQQLRAGFRRAYADKAPVKKKRFGFLRWTWRLTYLSALGGLGYIAYGIYQNRHPVEQVEPDPNKKTLVVLGRCSGRRNAAMRMC